MGQVSLFSSRPPKEKRPLSLRSRRRRTRALIALGVLVLIGALVYGVHALSYLSRFSLDAVVVNGAQDVPAALVSDHVQTILNGDPGQFFSRRNVLLYPRSEIEKGVVEHFPRIESAVASRPTLFSKTLLVQVKERSLFALWCHPQEAVDGGAQCFEMDASGFIYAESSGRTPEYTFEGGLNASTTPIGQRFATSRLTALSALLAGLGQSGFAPSGARIENDTDFTVPLGNGFLLKASFGAPSETLVGNLRIVLSSDALRDKIEQLEYIDLRFGDRVYYKLQGEQEVSGE